MKNKVIVSTLSFLLVLTFFLASNINEENPSSIRLRFTVNYTGDSIAAQKTGLLWALSYLGAALPKASFDKALQKKEKGVYELRINQLGFETFALKAMQKIIKELKASEEYITMGGIDLGEFVVFTLGSSWHYYAITGAKPSYTDFKSRFDFKNELVFPVLNSDVAKHHRLVRMTHGNEVMKMAFIAEEGEGDLRAKTFRPEVFEVFDIMKNGQLRFAIYNTNGNLVEASASKFGRAGKPVKCLWCHEINIQRLFTPNDSVKNYMSPREFQNNIQTKMRALQNYRKQLNSEIDFTKTQDHAFMELLYINYMEPSVFKLSNEWRQNLDSLTVKLGEIKKHPHKEYSFLNELMDRTEVKRFSPYTSVQLPGSIWEENNSEPNVFK